ncbi:MAG: radical SAM protein [Desulfobacteraceae bacterium]|jgi:histone acetyltransferase (RNA polymerase elongator complex component)|nr:MAG: radical SAM protein [Desulfobacteraceae bacterium]
MTVFPKPLVIPIFIPNLGCPHQCIFCNQRAVTGVAAKMSDAHHIRSTIKHYLQYKKPDRTVVELSFFGGNFLGLPAQWINRLLTDVAPFVADGAVDGIRFSTRPDTVDNARLRYIRKYPVTTIELGVQSMNDGVLAAANRGHTAAQTRAAAALLRENGYRVGLQMMIGLPEDTPETSLITAAAMMDLKPDFVRIYPTLVLADSPLADLYAQGHYTPLSLEACVLQLKTLYRLFAARGIPVIRMGLQASSELNDPSVVLAGPYHPALGHMVLSDIMLDAAKQALAEKKAHGKDATLTVHPAGYSRMQGLGKQNLETLKQCFGLGRVFVRTDAELPEDAVRVSC